MWHSDWGHIFLDWPNAIKVCLFVYFYSLYIITNPMFSTYNPDLHDGKYFYLHIFFLMPLSFSFLFSIWFPWVEPQDEKHFEKVDWDCDSEVRISLQFLMYDFFYVYNFRFSFCELHRTIFCVKMSHYGEFTGLCGISNLNAYINFISCTLHLGLVWKLFLFHI